MSLRLGDRRSRFREDTKKRSPRGAAPLSGTLARLRMGSRSLLHPGIGGFLWITDAHGSKGCTRISADSARNSGLRLQGRRGDAFGSVHGRPCNPRGTATRARSAQAGMPGCEEKCFLAFHPCASMCIRGFNSLLESTRRRDGGNGRPLGLPPWRARPNLKAVPGGR